jgi:hypothetical protein
MATRKYRVSILVTHSARCHWVQFNPRQLSQELDGGPSRSDEKVMEILASNIGVSTRQSGFISGMSNGEGGWVLVPVDRIVKYLFQIIPNEEKKEGQA